MRESCCNESRALRSRESEHILLRGAENCRDSGLAIANERKLTSKPRSSFAVGSTIVVEEAIAIVYFAVDWFCTLRDQPHC